MKKGERTKLELLKIAYNMFLAKGYENTSIDAIIKEAKIAIITLIAKKRCLKK